DRPRRARRRDVSERAGRASTARARGSRRRSRGRGGRVITAQAEPPTTVVPPPPIDVTPSSEGMPGAPLLHKLLSWLAQLALWGSLASILAGATVYGIAQ